MKRPRIILADTDENYMEPLEEKFLMELGEDTDIELITDPEYFTELFKSPQTADVLAVSEDLYYEELLKHDIRNIFLLTESEYHKKNSDGGVINIFKYSSLKEIYGRIIALSDVSFERDRSGPKKTMVIMVYSASGGTGKTTISLGISSCMAQNFKKVLYVNPDRMNTFQCHMKDPSPLPVGAGVGIALLRGGLYRNMKQYIRNERFDYLPPFGGALSSVNVDYGFYEKFIREAVSAGDYDVIVMDTDVVFDAMKVSLAAMADRVIMVTNQAADALFATDLLIENMNCSDNEKFYFICNGYIPEHSSAAVEKYTCRKFVIDEFISPIEGAENMTITDLGRNQDIQKIAFLME